MICRSLQVRVVLDYQSNEKCIDMVYDRKIKAQLQ